MGNVTYSPNIFSKMPSLLSDSCKKENKAESGIHILAKPQKPSPRLKEAMKRYRKNVKK